MVELVALVEKKSLDEALVVKVALLAKCPPMVRSREETSTAPEVESIVKAVVEALPLKVFATPFMNVSWAREDEAVMEPASVCAPDPEK